VNVGRLLWVTTRRRWQEEVVPLLVLGAVGWLHASAALGAAATAEPALEIPLLFATALAAALLIPMAMPGGGPFASLRFELLPWTPAHFFLLRLLLGQPLRMLLTLSAVLWTAIAVVRLATPVAAAAALAATATLAAAGLLLAQVVEDSLMRRRALGVLGTLSLGGVAALLALEGWGTVAPELVRVLPAGVADAPLLAWLAGPGRTAPSAGAWLQPLLVLPACFAALTAAVWLGYRNAAAHAAPPPAARDATTAGRTAAFIVTSAGRLAPQRQAWFAREVASLVRSGRISVGFLVSFLLAAAGFHFGVPWLLTGAMLFWALHASNLLAPDVPLAGLTRHDLLPVGIGTTLRLRHAAIVLLASSCAVVAGVLVAVAGGWAEPRLGPPSLLLYPLAHVFGVALLLVATLPGDRLAVRYAFWYDFPSRRRIGQQPPLHVGFAAMIAFFGLAAAVTAAGVLLARLLVPGSIGVAQYAVVFAGALLAAALLYTFVPAAGGGV
jgi:hypothetical protein